MPTHLAGDKVIRESERKLKQYSILLWTTTILSAVVSIVIGVYSAGESFWNSFKLSTPLIVALATIEVFFTVYIQRSVTHTAKLLKLKYSLSSIYLTALRQSSINPDFEVQPQSE
jgi:hypothetical protein